MTSSFGITPQRQVRDLVARPQTPAGIPAAFPKAFIVDPADKNISPSFK